MKRYVPLLLFVPLALLVLVMVACGQTPTDPQASLSPSPRRITGEGVPVIRVEQPVELGPCTPTATDEETSAVLALGLPANIDFPLQRAIYIARQQGLVGKLARVYIEYDPGTLSLSDTVTLVEQYGFTVQNQYERGHAIDGLVSLDILPQLAPNPGLVMIHINGSAGAWADRACPPPGAPTAIPITVAPPSP